MMKSDNNLLLKLCLLVLGTAFFASAALAQSDEEEDTTKTKQAQAVSKKVYDRIQQAQEKVDAKDYPGALRILNDLRGSDLTDYEQQNVLNYLGFVYYNMDDIKRAMQTYEEMLRIETIEPQIKKQTTYTLAQLSTMQEDYNKALRLLDQWFVLETNPPPDAYILYAQNLYQVNRFKDMIKPIETAISVAQKRETDVKEDWYVLLNFAYFQQEDYKKVRDIQKILLVNWPKKRYWFSLAGAYTELGEDKNLIAAYDAANTQNLLEKENEFVTMAQLYMQAEVPYKAATLLEQKIADGVVEKSARNYRLLSQAWQLAMEDEKAIPALQAAARMETDGELFVRLGNAYLNLGEYAKCEEAVRSGLEKGGLKSPDNAQISLGMCLYNQREYQNSIRAFREAGRSERSKRVANQWISVIESDIERNEQIRLAEAAARKRTEELEARRKKADRI
ncbi:MAG: tetratricopeptide repeat protein [Woeseia sp.]